MIGERNGQHLSVSDLQIILQNIANPLKDNPTNPVSVHPYRFVFLDGCDTAKGNLPEVFGIPKKVVSDADRNNKYGLFRRAFLGWTGSDAASVKGTMPINHKEFFERFFQLWSGQGSGQPAVNLGTALDQADQVPDYWTGGYDVGPLGKSIARYGSPTLPFYE